MALGLGWLVIVPGGLVIGPGWLPLGLGWLTLGLGCLVLGPGWLTLRPLEEWGQTNGQMEDLPILQDWRPDLE